MARPLYPDVFVVDPTTPPLERLDILYEGLIRPGAILPGLVGLAHQIVDDARARGEIQAGDPLGPLQAVLTWQSRAVRYQEDPTDPETGLQLELFKKPARAIDDGEDDCEGKTTVVCALHEALGFPSVPVWGDQPKSRNNHVFGYTCVPRAVAARVAPAGRYDLELTWPSATPRMDGVWLPWEATLGAVRLPSGVWVAGPRVGEHPYDVLGRYRAAGITRLGL